KRHRIAPHAEYYGDRATRRLGNWYRRGGARNNHAHPALHQIRRKGGQPVVFAPAPAVFDGNILTFEVAEFFSSPVKRRENLLCERIEGVATENPNPPPRLLRPRRKRPRRRHAADQ